MSVTLLQDFQIVGTSAEVDDPAALTAATGLSWLRAAVPGGVHEALLAAGVIGHPYFGANDAGVRWVEEATWWYRTRFAAARPDQESRTTLVFHGVDTVATVWLNEQRLGRHESQFRPAEFDITGIVEIDNELLVRFDPPLAGLNPPASVVATSDRVRAVMSAAMPSDGDAAEEEHVPGVLSGNPAMTLRRKGTFSWGWDFAPRLPSVGLIGPVELRTHHSAVITGHHLRATAVDAGARTATLAVDVEVETLLPLGALTCRLTLTPSIGTPIELTVGIAGTAESRSASAVFELEDVDLWWTHDLGHPATYGVVVEVLEGARTVASVTDRIGLRTVERDRSEDTVEGGRLFRFVLNGVPLFIRGANWVPADAMVGSVTPQRCLQLVGRARAANMTMLRVWGGGLYEQDAFYDACDAAGILVWQDFMFACTDYPSGDQALRAEVAAEAAFQVRRLRNHPSLALWAGNNEVHAIHQAVWGNLEPGDWGYEFFHDILPGAVEQHSPGTSYWPGCPWGDFEDRVNGVLDGDRHAWEVWHGVDVGAGGPTDFPSHGAAVHFSRYQYDMGKFISEFGIQSSPELATLQRWTPPGSLALHSPALDNRNKDSPKNKADAIMGVETGLPTSVEQFVENMMICQAEGLKFGIEHYRRRQPHCSGTLIWQLDDAWPGLSWSLIDYDLIAKAGYYYAQRAYTPVLASFLYTDGLLQLWVTNSGLDSPAMEFDVAVANYEGGTLIGANVAVTSEPGSSRVVWSARVDASDDHYAWVAERTGFTAANRLFFGPVKDQRFGAARLRHSVAHAGPDTVEILITAEGFNYLTRVEAPSPGVTFDHNYLDLRDGDSVLIRVGGLPVGFDASRLRVLSRGAVSTLTESVE